MANPELKTIMDRVQPRSTPVVIAHSLEWIEPQAQEAGRRDMRNLIEGWRVAPQWRRHRPTDVVLLATLQQRR